MKQRLRMFKRITLILAATAVAGISQAAPAISTGNYSSIDGSNIVTLDELTKPVNLNDILSSNTELNGVVISGGVAFGEHFAGQELSTNDNFDVLTGTPNQSLRLVAGATGENLYAALFKLIDLKTLQFDSVLSGVSKRSASSTTGIGEGAVSMLFSSDQSQFGVQLVGMNGGTVHFGFFRNDGSLIQELDISAADKSYIGFFRDGGVKDIRGVSIWSSDPNGMAINNVRHDVASNASAVPEPAQWALISAGLLALRWRARRAVAKQRHSRTSP